MADAIVRVVESRATVVIPGVEALAPLVAAIQSAADEAKAAAAQIGSLQAEIDALTARVTALETGGGVPNPILTSTIMRDSFVMRDTLRMTANG